MIAQAVPAGVVLLIAALERVVSALAWLRLAILLEVALGFDMI